METSVSSAAVITDKAFEDVNIALTECARALESMDARRLDIHSVRVTAPIRELLIQQSLQLKTISMSVLDADGAWIISSRYNPVRPYHHNPKRPVYHKALETKSSSSFFLPMEASPVIGGFRTIVQGRTVRRSNGSLIGIVLAFPLIDSLKEPFRTLVPEGKWIFFTDAAGNDLLVSPQSPGRIPQWMKTGWKNTLTRGGGHFVAADDNGRQWIVVVSGHPNSQVIYTVIKPVVDVLTTHRNDAATNIFYALAVEGMVVVLSLLWGRQRWVTHQKMAAATKADQERLKFLSHDAVTQLLNRAGLKEELERTSLSHRASFLITIGFQGFETILQMLGSDAEDSISVQIALRIKDIIADRGLAARLNSDLFAAALYVDDPEEMCAVLIRDLEKPYHFAEIPLHLGIYIGIVPVRPGSDWRILLRDSGIAMLRAKESSVGCFRWFQPQVDNPLREKLRLAHDLRSAIGTDQLHMVYQPIYSVGAGRVVGFEALMRWNHPSLGNVPPSLFIPIAEKTGNLLPVEKMVLRSPFVAAAQWPDDVFVAVNFPASEFRDPGLSARLLENLEAAGLRAYRCCIEVTETALLEFEDTVISNMHELKKLGVKLALDDFGTGHSSLSYLHRFPFDRIKIDRAFVQDMGVTPVANAIVEATITLCFGLGIEVVAEGVESPKQLGALTVLGCNSVQGFLIGRPMSEEDVTAFLNDFQLDMHGS